MSIYDSLNTQQYEAVLHDKGPLLLLAGAGSGKTRVLTHRIAYLIEHRDVNPWNILAITFTNKAAKEMRERVDKIVGFGSENIWVSTFHSTCVQILRRWIDTIGYDRNFTIYDSDDQKTLMKEVCKYLEIDTKNLKERALLNVISKAKDDLITPDEFELNAGGDYQQKKYAACYREYQKRLKSSNALDFDDLIFKTVELFQTNKEALKFYQKRFKYIMVDEYQDTNHAQFKLISLLASHTNELGEIEHNLCVVGDDDQSIYKFRGANIYNILNFEKEYPSAKVIKLEQNYRSTQNILNAANEVIANNKGRKDKKLWTQNEEGEPIQYTQFGTDFEEADSIVSEIGQMVRNGSADYKDFAILYRTNAQSRAFEEKFVTKNIKYKIIGGVNFYARKEVKDLLSYLKTIDNGLDNLAVRRIINVPRRGIGLTTIDRINDYATNNEISFYEALKQAEYIPGLNRAAAKITSFVSLIEGLKRNLENPSYSLRELMDEILEATGYLKELEQEGTEEAEDRINNIDELINRVAAYEESCEEEIPTLSGFLEDVALVADIDNLEESEDYVVLMTLHSAKGLEFPYVYLCGMEEGIFPGYMTLNAENVEEEMEEERRLCYVGITRAMKRLSISAARQRMIRGETQYNRPSRFINEIPRYLLAMTGAQPGFSPFSSTKNPSSFLNFESKAGSVGKTNAEFLNFQQTSGKKVSDLANNQKISSSSLFNKPNSYSTPKNFGGANLGTLEYGEGDIVKHIKFGTGVVTNINAAGKDYEVTVDFPNSGTKKMLASFAKLKKIIG